MNPAGVTSTETLGTATEDVANVAVPTAEQCLDTEQNEANYMRANEGPETVTEAVGALNETSDSPPGDNAGGITLMQTSPPPASYRHSRSYRHFKNPPQPHMCIRTTTESGEELFINVLSWTRIVIPQEPSDPIPLYGGMRVPPGSPRSPPIVFAVMANPEVLKDSGRHSKDAEERRAMVELMCDFVEAMNPGVKLVRNAVILKDRDISGELKDVWNAVQAQRDREREEQLLQQRQQQQYVTTQQMFPKPGQSSPTTAAPSASATTSTTAQAPITTNTQQEDEQAVQQHLLPTPTPIIVGGRCGSLAGSGFETPCSKTSHDTAFEEDTPTACEYEASTREESEGSYVMATALTTSTSRVACADTPTTTGTSSCTITGTAAAPATTAVGAAAATAATVCATITANTAHLIAANNIYDHTTAPFLMEHTPLITTPTSTRIIEQFQNHNMNVDMNVDVVMGNDNVDAVENQQNVEQIVVLMNNNNNINNNRNNQKLSTIVKNTNNIDHHQLFKKTAMQQQQENGFDTMKSGQNECTNEPIIMAATTTTTKTTENHTAIHLITNNCTTSATKVPNNAATTITTTMPTKREKLGGFLPNSCIFPRFKNHRNKDKEKEKEVKCKDKEKTLLQALKKSKDKKVAPMNQDKKSQSNKQDKIATSTQQQQQQQQDQEQQQFVDKVAAKTQYEKNCINLENDMQKLDMNNKINESTTNNSEKNMFIKLKCAATSAVAK